MGHLLHRNGCELATECGHACRLSHGPAETMEL